MRVLHELQRILKEHKGNHNLLEFELHGFVIQEKNKSFVDGMEASMSVMSRILDSIDRHWESGKTKHE